MNIRPILAGTMTVALFSTVAGALEIKPTSASAAVGFINPEGGIESTIGFQGRVNLATIQAGEFQLGLVPFLDYWSKTYDESTWLYNYEWKYSQFNLGAALRYDLPLKNLPVQTYVGAGLMLSMTRWSWDWSTGDDSDSDFGLGTQFYAGADYPLNEQFTAFGEIRLSYAEIDYMGILIGARMGL